MGLRNWIIISFFSFSNFQVVLITLKKNLVRESAMITMNALQMNALLHLKKKLQMFQNPW